MLDTLSQFLKNKKIVLISSGVFLCWILLVLLLLGSTTKKNTQTNSISKQTPLPDTRFYTTSIVKISPDITTILQPKIQQRFIISFTDSFNPSIISFSIQYEGPGPLFERKGLAFTQIVAPDRKTVTLVLTAPISPDSTYVVFVTNKNSNQELLHATYYSDHAQPTPLPKNNTSLATFLPHQGQNYTLEYSTSENLYIAHFTPNYRSPISPGQQYTTAQSDVQQFIKSKGIDPKSVIITWTFK